MLAHMIAMEIRAKTRTILAQTPLILLIGPAYALFVGGRGGSEPVPIVGMLVGVRVHARDRI